MVSIARFLIYLNEEKYVHKTAMHAFKNMWENTIDDEGIGEEKESAEWWINI